MSPKFLQNMSPQRKVLTGLGSLGLAGAVVLGGASLASADTTTGTTGTTAASSSDTAVTGSEATKVSAAVTAKDSAVSVTEVRQDPDGSYDVLGTKAGASVFYDVSADLATITLNSGHGGGHDDGDASADSSAGGTAA